MDALSELTACTVIETNKISKPELAGILNVSVAKLLL